MAQVSLGNQLFINSSANCSEGTSPTGALVVVGGESLGGDLMYARYDWTNGALSSLKIRDYHRGTPLTIMNNLAWR